MKRNSIPVQNEVENLAEDAQALVAATMHVAEEKVVEARKRLSVALENGKEVWFRMQDRAIEGVKATDKVVRTHPYQAIGVALGVGVLIGYLLKRRD